MWSISLPLCSCCYFGYDFSVVRKVVGASGGLNAFNILHDCRKRCQFVVVLHLALGCHSHPDGWIIHIYEFSTYWDVTLCKIYRRLLGFLAVCGSGIGLE